MVTSSSSQPEPLIRTTAADAESIVSAIVSAVTEVNDAKPATPLYEAINPDALESLFQHSSPKVSFEYIGYRVTIHPDRTISVADVEA
ncbi:HalOD1 output domain-containing protein [Haladaptatus halobius]|uniref:HalOD1 output domain-containing protein n=1 Tax=Haladaptatus halobius TaxID=2884875 RepID=UPI001D0B46E3